MKLELGVRKIQVIRGTSFVSLPRTWIKNLRLKKGDRVNIGLRDDGILEISNIIVSKEGDEIDVP